MEDVVGGEKIAMRSALVRIRLILLDAGSTGRGLPMVMNKDTSQVVSQALTEEICSKLEDLDVLAGHKATLGLKTDIYNIIIYRLRTGVEL